MKRKFFLLLCALLVSVGMWAGDVQREVTSTYLTNTTFDSNLDGWTNDGMERKPANEKFSTAFAQVWTAGTQRTASIKQSITNLPAGTYRLTAKCIGGYQNEPVSIDPDYLYATPSGQSTSKADVNWISGDMVEERVLEFVNDAVQNVEIGFVANNTKWWSAIDDVKLYAVDIAAASYELPNSTVTAGNWYRFTTGNSSDAYVLSSSGTATVSYTTDGTITDDDVVTDTWALTNKLNIVLAPSTTYYIKSDAAVTLTKTETSVSSSLVTGWTKVTSLEQLAVNPKDYFFAFFSANNTGLYLINRNETNEEKLRYVTAGNPLNETASLFEVENYDGDFVLKSTVNSRYFENRPTSDTRFEKDGPWNYHADLAERDENCRTTLSFHDGVCTIQDKNDDDGNKYIGLWYPDHGYINREILAGNKSEAEKASFIIYRIPKDDCDFNNLIQDADFSSTSEWTQEHSSEYWALGNGLIGTYAVANDKKSTTDETHLATEYCLGIQCRWNTNYASFAQTTSPLPVGYYTLSFDVQNTNTSTTSATYVNRFKVTVGDDVYTDSKTEWMSGNSSWTTHTISFSITEAAAATISLGYGMGNNNFESGNTPHLYVSHLRLDYSSYADDVDYAELNAAISAVESNRLGFEAGEYAPYNNADALAKLEAANAINQEVSNLKSVVKKAASDLADATWTANATDVDAIFNGSFSSDVEGDWGLTGWTRTNGWGQQQTGLSGKYATAYYNHPGSLKHGDTGAYTMPLAASTCYKLSFAYRSHQEYSNKSMTVSVLNDENEGLVATYYDANPSITDWAEKLKLFTTGAAGNYVLTLANSGNTWITGVSLVKATVEEARSLLNEEIETATEIYNSGANVGTGVFQIPVASGTAFSEAIAAAQDVYDDGSATADEVTTAINELKTAMETYANVTLNAPDANKAYYLVHVASGLAADLGTVTLNSDASLAYPVYFTSVEGNSYKISKDKTNYVAYAGGNKWTLNTTTTIDNAAVCTFAYIGEGKYSITSANGSFGTDNTTGGSSIYGNKAASVSNSEWYIYDASANMAVNPTAQWGTFCASFDVAIPDDVTAYTCESASDGGSLNLTEVTGTIPANTPVILNAGSGLGSTIFYGKKVANESDDIIDDGGLLRGNVSSSTKDVPSDGSAYLMQLHGDKVGFYRVNGTGYLIGSNRCYLVSGSSVGAREVFFFEDDATAISALEAAKAESGALKDGKYLIEGKIVIVKNGAKYSANGQILK